MLNRPTLRQRLGTLVVLLVAVMTATACTTSDLGPPAGTLPVLTSFYPLQFVTEQVGGRFVRATNLTKPGVDPHDLELTPQEVASVDDAATRGLLVYLNGFQPALDSAVTSAGGSPARILDVTSAAQLTLPAPTGGAETTGGVDPHFWLDPTRLAAVAQLIAARLGQLDPAHAAVFQRRAGALDAQLQVLDRQFTRGLAHCSTRDLVTSHTAFGYLAVRYHLVQQGIVGLNPEAEPTSTQLADIATFVKAHNVTTIFYEPLVSPAVADTVARETGATTAMLDPLEGLTSSDPSATYFTVMRHNLNALRTGLGCS